MDPALWELLRAAKDEDAEEVEAIIRLDSPQLEIPGVRIVARFGPIATCRLRRDSILRTRDEENVKSLKAPRLFGPEREAENTNSARKLPLAPVHGDQRRPGDITLTGKGVVIGIIDWGCDFNHTNFRRACGRTRITALWDQRKPSRGSKPSYYGYGTVHDWREIDRALRTADPYGVLGYRPADADPSGSGAHGTHVMDIAAGNGRGNGPGGIAPEAELVFVHLANKAMPGLANLGDSVRILEAADFIARTAGGKPWVINLSVGRHGGPHDGSTLAEMAFDFLLRAAPGRFIVQSAGNYFNQCIHASGRLQSGETHTLRLVVDEADTTPNELEVWYSGEDSFAIRIESPTGALSPWVRLGESSDILESGSVVGRIYNRDSDPNNFDNHIDIFLYTNAPPGPWAAILKAERVSTGLFHAWLERDEACAGCQTRFNEADCDSLSTTGTLANSRVPLVVGAYDAHSPTREIAPFSSVGPTRDHRSKPDLVAPGVGVLAARSAPGGGYSSQSMLTRKSGTSMAAPHVTGTVALCLERARGALWSHELRKLILDSTQPAPVPAQGGLRFGRGYLDVQNAVEAAAALSACVTTRPTHATSRRRNHLQEGNMTHKLDQYFDSFEQIVERSRPREASGTELVAAMMCAMRAPVSSSSLDLHRLYREIVFERRASLTKLGERFIILGRPGELPTMAPQPGDVLVRIALGEPGLAHAAVLTDGALWPAAQLLNGPFRCEGCQSGFYAPVIEFGPFPHTRSDPFARRVLDTTGRMPPGQLLLRIKSFDNDDEPSFGHDFNEAEAAPEERKQDPGAISDAAAEREIHAALDLKVPPGSTKRRDALAKAFRKLSPATAARLNTELQDENNPIRKKMALRLDHRSIPDLLKILKEQAETAAVPTVVPTPDPVSTPSTVKRISVGRGYLLGTGEASGPGVIGVIAEITGFKPGKRAPDVAVLHEGRSFDLDLTAATCAALYENAKKAKQFLMSMGRHNEAQDQEIFLTDLRRACQDLAVEVESFAEDVYDEGEEFNVEEEAKDKNLPRMKFEIQTSNRIWRNDGKSPSLLGRKYGPDDFLVDMKGVRLESESHGVLEFETEWFRKWSALETAIKKAVQMTKDMDGAAPSRFEKKRKAFPFNVDHLRRGSQKEMRQGYWDKKPGMEGKNEKILGAAEELEVEILDSSDPKWVASIQSSESFFLEQYESYLKDHEWPHYRDAAIKHATAILNTANTSGLTASQLIRLRNFLLIVVNYVMRGQGGKVSDDAGAYSDVKGKAAKQAFTLMSRTSFASMFGQLLTSDEKKLFTKIVESDSILQAVGLNRQSPFFIKGYGTDEAGDHAGPRVYEWLKGIYSGKDLLSGRSGSGLSAAMGRYDVEIRDGKKDQWLVKFETRNTVKFETWNPGRGAWVKAAEWPAYASRLYKLAAERRTRQVSWVRSSLGSKSDQFLDTMASGDVRGAISLAHKEGVTNENRLTNLVFHTLHVELGGRSIRQEEKSLARKWLQIRDASVRPFLRSLNSQETIEFGDEEPLAPDELLEEGEHASSSEDVRLKSADSPLHFLGVDVTDALDTVAWGHLWNAKFGWRNLLWELDKDSADSQRRVDKSHPGLPIVRLVRKDRAGTRYADTCLLPQGIDAKGTDKLWSGADEAANMAEINAACGFTQTFLLMPGADKATSSLNDTGTGLAADVIYISSHGQSTGDMTGDIYVADPIFSVSKAAASGAQFSGVGWLLLSNCSTLKASTYEDWLKLMTGPNPLRGVVGFQDTCPLAEGSVKIFTRFIRRLAKGKTFLRSWAEALEVSGLGDRWIVLCHENAVDDTIIGFNTRTLKAIPPTSKVLKFDKADPTGVEVLPVPDPFEAFWSKGGTRITPANRLDSGHKLAVGDTITITVKPPPGVSTFTAGTKISVTVVYVRTNYPHAIDVTKLFKVVRQSGISSPTTADLNPDNPAGPDSWQATVTADPKAGDPKSIVLELECLDLSGLHPNYTLWLRVDISTERHDFVRNGSLLIKESSGTPSVQPGLAPEYQSEDADEHEESYDFELEDEAVGAGN